MKKHARSDARKLITSLKKAIDSANTHTTRALVRLPEIEEMTAATQLCRLDPQDDRTRTSLESIRNDLSHIGHVLDEEKLPDGALSYVRCALRVNAHLDVEDDLSAWLYKKTGLILYNQKRHAESLEQLQRAMALFEKHHSEDRTTYSPSDCAAYCSMYLVYCARDLGDVELTYRFIKEMMKWSESEHFDRKVACWILINVAMMAIKNGRYEFVPPLVEHTLQFYGNGEKHYEEEAVRLAGILRSHSSREAAAVLTESTEKLFESLQLPKAVPVTRTADCVDQLHGHKIEDPFRWLEETSPERESWERAQNCHAGMHLGAIVHHESTIERYRDLFFYAREEQPFRINRSCFYMHAAREALVPSLYMYPYTAGVNKSRLVLDCEALAKDGNNALHDISISRDAKWLAYGVSINGSDWETWHIKNIDSGVESPEVLSEIRRGYISWSPDCKSFYYTKYTIDGDCRYATVLLHKVGQQQSTDREIYKGVANETIAAQVSGDYLLLYVSVDERTDNQIYFRRLNRMKEPFRRLLPEAEGIHAVWSVDRNTAYFTTTWNAPRGRLLCVDLKTGTFSERIPESDKALKSIVVLNKKRLLARYSWGAKDSLVLHEAGTTKNLDVCHGPVSLTRPSTLSQHEISGAIETFISPSVIYKHDFNKRKTETIFRPDCKFDSLSYKSYEVPCTSSDGTPLWLILNHHMDVKPNETTPFWLTAYGGFRTSLHPTFDPAAAIWMEKGGVFAVAIIRGGGEFGEEWHQSGIRDRRQNVIEDFISVAKHVSDSKLTSKEKLVVTGGSNGGLLIAAALAQKPELFGGAVITCPLTDMVRFHKKGFSSQWIAEYGDPDEQEDFNWLIKYSPYHNIRTAVYPPTLIQVPARDDRVDPLHGMKLAAKLQSAQKGDAPIFLRIYPELGHGESAVGSDLGTDSISFLLNVASSATDSITPQDPADLIRRLGEAASAKQEQTAPPDGKKTSA